MKKIVYCIVLIFALFIILGGVFSISEKGMDLADFILLLIFSLLSIFCIYKLIKLTRSNKKEMVEENHYNKKMIALIMKKEIWIKSLKI